MSILSQNFVNFSLFPLAFLLLLTQCSISVDAIRCWKGIGAELEVNIHKLPPDVPMNVSLEHLQKLETIEFDGTVKGKVRCDFLVQKCMKTVCTGDAYSMNNMVINEEGSVLGDFVTLTKNPQVNDWQSLWHLCPHFGCWHFECLSFPLLLRHVRREWVGIIIKTNKKRMDL
ncbi:hypothetical protein niasHT_037799 [Heterodera trifolii]|uniref:Uncharacterized protein n=1 Tax=Heterodera trifolii TaxID=157864 RepID=A0ABD2I3U2_9BILA